MTIIEANSKHIDELSILFDMYRQFYQQPSDFPNAKKFLSERIAKKESVIYISMDEGKFSGFVQLYPLFTSVGMKQLWLLNDLFVKAEYRNKGIARNLINRCKKLAEETNASGLMLETSKNNLEGNTLYPDVGFVLQEDSNFYVWKTSFD
jgi:GNAT superfamily N-acetyltransferase